MITEASSDDERIWKQFLRRHWRMSAVLIAAAVVVVIGAILVFLWFVGEAQSTGLVPETLDLWTMGHLVSFLLNLLLWEIVFIGIPVIVFVVAVFLLWWRRLSFEERMEYRRGRLFGMRSRGTSGGGISFLVFIVFIIKVYIDGNWNVPFANWSFDYLVYSYLTAFIWVLIIFGIPVALGLIWWIRHEMKKQRY